jgi:hypothetical protein
MAEQASDVRRKYRARPWRTGVATAFVLLVHAQVLPGATACTTAEARAAIPAPGVWTSRSGDFRLRYSSDLDPLVINRMHNWILGVETADGKPVEDARISVVGGMPDHDHGLPTQPQVTRYLGDGKYLLEGMRFHMPGDWEISVTIETPGQRDVVRIPLTL